MFSTCASSRKVVSERVIRPLALEVDAIVGVNHDLGDRSDRAAAARAGPGRALRRQSPTPDAGDPVDPASGPSAPALFGRLLDGAARLARWSRCRRQLFGVELVDQLLMDPRASARSAPRCAPLHASAGGALGAWHGTGVALALAGRRLASQSAMGCWLVAAQARGAARGAASAS